MKKLTLVLAAASLLGGLALGAGSVSAAPMAVGNRQADTSGVTPVRMMRGHRMMMRKRMMRKRTMMRRM